ncbi:MAG: crossover junction endodeoxyribonuclease RuvC [Nitrospirota bacterium]|nr:crossover junction endodeoxyribonuclease RuvC [Nitrospirota bacterium]
MRVLGVDPGTVSCGFGIVDEEDHRLFHVACGAIKNSSKVDLHVRLKKIYDGLDDAIKAHRPHAMAIEEVFFAKNPHSALVLGHARGVAMLAAVNNGIPVFEYTALVVKQSVVGYGRAEKAQVQEMMKMLLKLKEIPKPADASDALAIAICHLMSVRMKEVRGR